MSCGASSDLPRHGTTSQPADRERSAWHRDYHTRISEPASAGWAPSKNPGEKNKDFSQSPLRTAKVAKKKPYFMSSLRSWRCFAPLRETLRLPYPVMNARCVFHHC